ncbi:Signal transduction histidine kinase [Evansella caseinilytica]|uniref:histidine kinase n=1 Tax=Evansella caseinilytica TaxID=1503961 RepID=A0A1H3IMR8_9BACI|nr:HAMP domain-containing sensor histidine kinase [Evansella caseinilytica]SDY28982.1 Signal transduction histidine kinase [Evansella caseinilytica]
MKSTKRRLAFRFTFQFIIFSILAVIICGLLILNVSDYLTKEEIKRNFTIGTLDTIISETTVTDDEVWIHSSWEELLAERNMWLQVINEEGKVIHSIHAPSDLPDSYTLQEIMKINETKRYLHYKIFSSIDTYYQMPYLYFLGYESKSDDLLLEWVNTYQDVTQLSDDELEQLTAQVKAKNGRLDIIDEQGMVVKSIGNGATTEEGRMNYTPVGIVAHRQGLSNERAEVSVYYDTETNYTWILKSDRGEVTIYGSFLREIIAVLFVAAAIILLLGILFTVWHATRYGQPLLLFITWLEKLGQGNYQEVLNAMQDKKVLNRKGKVRSKYKLYEEVITAFKEMAGKLKQSEEEREQLDTTREAWMTGISHDLRTPLSSIQGYGHMLESDHYEWTATELREIGATIREKGEYMLQLVEDFSLAFQLKNSSLPLKREEIKLDEFLQHTVLALVNDVTIKNVNFSFENAADEPIYYAADVHWFERMLLNLLLNAVKHNPEGTEIVVTIDKDESRIYIKIEDDGIGMDEETQRFLFERYYRGINTSEKVDGTGLGMSIAKGIVEAHGGDITVQSKQLQGTTLTLRFPV